MERVRVKRIDLDHALAHLRCARQIVCDMQLCARDVSTFSEAISDAEVVLKRQGTDAE
ncbi:MAG: hypothetical protein KGL39_09150 [Patescibacteria group bacterium]|nr:hypothetical protein [Patescibacteria group bacterium]